MSLAISGIRLLGGEENICENDDVDCEVDVKNILSNPDANTIQGVQLEISPYYDGDPDLEGTITITPAVIDLGDFGPNQIKTAQFHLKLKGAKVGASENWIRFRATGTIPLNVETDQVIVVTKD